MVKIQSITYANGQYTFVDDLLYYNIANNAYYVHILAI